MPCPVCVNASNTSWLCFLSLSLSVCLIFIAWVFGEVGVREPINRDRSDRRITLPSLACTSDDRRVGKRTGEITGLAQRHSVMPDAMVLFLTLTSLCLNACVMYCRGSVRLVVRKHCSYRVQYRTVSFLSASPRQ